MTTERVIVHRTPNFEFFYEPRTGDAWMPHPLGGIIVCNPERKPIWLHAVDGFLVQEVLEPVASDNMIAPVALGFFTR
jgi:hypothetical protein